MLMLSSCKVRLRREASLRASVHTAEPMIIMACCWGKGVAFCRKDIQICNG